MADIVNIEIADRAVALPVDKKALGEFISSLLGQPQTLEQKFDSAFSADHQWFVHLFHLILQRIQQQNAPEPLSFTAAIRYRDDLERKITSWHAFQHFSESQNIVSIAVKFHLALLIQFPTKEAPERQELVFTFDSRYSRPNFVEALAGKRALVGGITIEIRHTERTWADDLLRLIENELGGIQVVEGRLRRFLRQIYLPLFLFMIPLTTFGSIVLVESANYAATAVTRAKIYSVLEGKASDLQTLHAKIDLLLGEAARISAGRLDNLTTVWYPFLVLLVMLFAGKLLIRPTPSFVVLSPAAARNRTETIERLKRKNLWILLSMIGSITLGAIGNFVYDFLK